MTSQMAVDLLHKTIYTAALVSAPVLITSMVIGILVNIIQTVTSIKDMSLSFVPKLLGSALVMGLTMPWAVEIMNGFFTEMYMMFGTVTP